MKKLCLGILALGVFGAVVPSARAEEIPMIEISIKDHKFSQGTIEVKSGQKFKLKISNNDPSSEEFESKTMIIEKFIGPNNAATVILGPLKPGTYEFYGEYHQSTAKGKVIAK